MIGGDAGYALLDCGDGRRLERVGGITVVRPAPAARFPVSLPGAEWRGAGLEFARERGWRGDAPGDWRVAFGPAVLGLRPAAAGQIGVFPEHVRVAEILEAALDAGGSGAPSVLNLFAHTGLLTLRLAARKAAVAHVDASASAVRRARENAALSGLEEAPVRWLVDDALSFMRREVRRGRRYDLVAADPPSHGRGKGGEWSLRRNLPELLDLMGALLKPGATACLSCHSEGVREEDASALMRKSLPALREVRGEELSLCPESGGRSLRAGFVVFGR